MHESHCLPRRKISSARFLFPAVFLLGTFLQRLSLKLLFASRHDDLKEKNHTALSSSESSVYNRAKCCIFCTGVVTPDAYSI